MRNDGSCCTRETESISVPAALLHINVGKLQVKCFTWHQGWTEGEKQMSVLVMQNVLLLFSVLFFSYIFPLTEAPGTASVKFNIPKRPYQVQCSPMSNQTFPPGEQPSGLNPTPSSLASASAASGGAQTRWELVCLLIVFLFFPISANNMLT